MAVTLGVGAEHMAVANAISMSGKDPVQVTCPTCHQQITTRIVEEIGTFTWLLAGCLLIL
jgi:hypothetical protein